MSWIDGLFPGWALARAQKRAALKAITGARHYEAASTHPRISGWNKASGDANAVIALASPKVRALARDLVRNNGWARRAVATIVNGVVGWGARPQPRSPRMQAIWDLWGSDESVQCDARERSNLLGLQRQIVRSVVIDGEVIVRLRARQPRDGLIVPLQLQALEADHLDSSKDGETGIEGGPIVRGVELDALGRRVAYWLFDQHPGASTFSSATSRRVPAAEVLHVYDPDRAGGDRGISWLAAAIVDTRDLADLDSAELMRQKIAACFAAFVTDVDGAGSPLGLAGTDTTPAGGSVDALEPGMIVPLPPGKSVSFASPPPVVTDDLARRTLRRMAASLGVTYEDLTGDYSQVNFSSARMGRLAYQANVQAWQSCMLVPQFLAPVYEAVSRAATGRAEPAAWTLPALPLLDPDREGTALQRLVRTGAMTPSEMVRSQGYDPAVHWAEYARDVAAIDAAGLVLDCDARQTTQAGQAQQPAQQQEQAP